MDRSGADGPAENLLKSGNSFGARKVGAQNSTATTKKK